MAVATESRPDVPAAYLIPTGFLVDAWSILKAQAIPPSPYRGLAAFREQDASSFFGRENVVNQLLGVLDQHAMVGVIGPSGSGKSSVVFAGLIPALRSQGDWIIVHLRPSTMGSPFEALAMVLLSMLEPQMTEAERLREVPILSGVLSDGRLLQVVGRILDKARASRLLVVVDQFEELYSSSTSMAQQFITTLLEASNGEGPKREAELNILFALRADFLGQVMGHPGFAEALQGAIVMIGPMSRANLKLAIEEPARHQVAFEPGLIERILDDVGHEPGNLPLLEFTLTLLWQRQTFGRLTHTAYDELNGVDGSLTRYAEQVYESLSEPEREDMRRVFLQLIKPGQGTGHTRRISSRVELGDQRWALVQRLATSRLLVTDRDLTGVETVELAHEALMAGWTRLAGWVDADRAFRAWQEESRSAIHRWEASGHDEGALLRGVLLAEAQRWLEERLDDISPTEREFIKRSGDVRDRELREMRRRNRWLRRSSVALSILVVVALVSALVAQQQTRRAESENRIAVSRQLAAQAISSLEARPDQSLLHSLRALRAADTVEAHKGLLAVLQRDPRLSALLPARGLVSALAFSPDGQLLATNDETDIALWSVPQLQPLTRLKGGREGVSSLAFSPDGRMLVAGGHDGRLTVWDIERRLVLRRFDTQSHARERGPVSRVAFSPDGTLLAAAAWFSGVFIWDIKQQRTRVLAGSKPKDEQIYGVAFSSNGRYLAVSGYTGIGLWDTTTSRRQLASLVEERIGSGGFYDVTFTQNDKTLVALGEEEVVLWDRRSGRRITRLPGIQPPGPFSQFSIQGHGSDKVAVPTTSGVVLWDVHRRRVLGEPMIGNDKPPSVVAFSSDGETLAVGGEASLTLWNIKRSTYLGHSITRQSTYSLAFTADGRTLATGSDSGIVTLWDGTQMRKLTSFTTHPSSPVGNDEYEDHPILSVAFSPTDEVLATSDSNSVVLWDLKHRRPLAQPLTEDPGISGYSDEWSIAFNPRSSAFYTLDRLGIILWDALGWKKTKTFAREDGSLLTIAVDPRGTVLAAANESRVFLWDAKDLRRLGKPLTSGSPIAFSPDGQTLAAASKQEQSVLLWDVGRQRLLGKLAVPNRNVTSLAFSSDGRTLAIGSEDFMELEKGTVTLWDVKQQEALGRPLLGAGRNIVFTLDGERLLAAGQAGLVTWDVSVRLWQAQACTLLRPLGMSDIDRVVTRSEFDSLCS